MGRSLKSAPLRVTHNGRARSDRKAINLGKATFSQKPLAHNIYECYALGKAAREKKVIAEINMGSSVYCTPIPANGALFIGNRNQLFAIAEKK